MDAETARDLILIVDDDVEAASAIAAFVGRAGLAVAHASDGAAALALLDTLRPSLVLLDAVMPRLDGFETCRAIKAVDRWRDVPVIFMTGLADTTHVVAGLQAGGVDYVVKPVVLPELLARIDVHLATARHARSVRGAIDASGRALFALDTHGAVTWATPEARLLLDRIGASGEEGAAVRAAIGGLLPGVIRTAAVADVSVRRIDTRAEAGAVFRIDAPEEDQADLQRLRDVFALTPREAGVLQWIARGKSNRDVSVILNISTRTVDKHLEQIFRKMAVENRSAATARTLAVLRP